jgi:2-polyprenyl-3-methyl-5-hydroxy-6-metoxy-1,4-benzoquinol methylase
MATVFMKWLESSPKDYNRGIRVLTLGRLQRVKERIVRDYIAEGTRVLEIGCGTGALLAMMAAQGAIVTGIDASPAMLAEAKKRIAIEGLEERVSLKYMDAALIGERFAAASFDVIVSTLVFSELPPDEQRFVLEACAALLAPGGRLLIADEVVPSQPLARLLFRLVRAPLVLLTWLLTRTTTTALRDFDSLLAGTELRARAVASHLGGSLILYEIVPAHEAEREGALLGAVVGTLRYHVSPRTLLVDLWALFLRIIPPYPKVRPGLYAVGRPDQDSSVLVTGNFDLTVRRLVRAIDGQLDAWVLVADSAGINVWCAAGGGYFTAEKVIAALKSTRLEEVVRHRALILPQLCANGVDGWRVRQETGWGVHWGPVRAEHIPAYLSAKRQKNAAMRWVKFPLKDRLEMVTVTLGFYGLLILLPVALFWRALFWPVVASLVGLSYFYAVVHPWLPGRDGLWKSIPLALIALMGLFAYTALWNPLPAVRLFRWAIGLTWLSVFTAAELQGMSPLMRGEQANWGWEVVISAALALVYWLTPLALGWR